jgi:hypothetical protein
MHLLQAGVDISVTALWLGHESLVTTHHYVEADLTMKERALAKLHEPQAKIQRYRAPDSLINFLNTLRLCKGRNSSLPLPPVLNPGSDQLLSIINNLA